MSSEILNKEMQEDVKIYELGYHIVPTVGDENLPAEVSKVKTSIESHGGMFISEEFPVAHELAYTITKKIDTANKHFNKTYFGWVKFETTPGEVEKIKTELDFNANILRYIIIKTVRENTLVGTKLQVAEKITRGARPEEKPIQVPQMSQEEIDKSIDSLVIE